MYCSNRGRRRGCGRTAPVFLAGVLPRHTLSAPLFWQVLLGLLRGESLPAAARGVPMALESVRGACRRLARRLDAVRASLCARQTPAAGCGLQTPLLQTLEHLRAVFPEAGAGACPLARYQAEFQKPLMG